MKTNMPKSLIHDAAKTEMLKLDNPATATVGKGNLSTTGPIRKKKMYKIKKQH